MTNVFKTRLRVSYSRYCDKRAEGGSSFCRVILVSIQNTVANPASPKFVQEGNSDMDDPLYSQGRRLSWRKSIATPALTESSP